MPGRPTIRPHPSFNPDSDAEELKQAMKGMGTDEKRIINVLANRSAAQRKQIASRYLALYGKNLKDALKSELTGNFEDVVLASLLEVPEMKASFLRKAMKGAGTDERVLVQVISVASNQEILQLKQAYKDLFSRDLEKDVAGETSGDLKRILIAILQAQRDESGHIDHNKVEIDADALYKCGEGYKKTLIDAIKSETSGNYRDVLVAIVANAEDPIDMYAKWIHDSMAGMGTRDDDLIRLILSRAEIDLEDIKEAYHKMNKKLLTTAIQSETSGDYKRMLVAIVDGGH